MSYTGHIVATEKSPTANAAVINHHGLLRTMSRRSSNLPDGLGHRPLGQRSDIKPQIAPKLVSVGLTIASRVVTERGRVSIGSLVAGDKIWTLDSGMCQLNWVVQRTVKFCNKTAHLRPIKIAAGSFGPGSPLSDIRVAPGQRLLINDWRAKQYFGVPEVLVRATDLVGQPGVTRDDECESEIYAYLNFDGFELIETSGLISESYVHERRLDLYKGGTLKNSDTLPPSRPLIEAERCGPLHKAEAYDPVAGAKRRRGGLRSYITAPRA